MPDLESRVTELEEKVLALSENQEAIIGDVAKMPESLVLNFRVLARNLDAKFAAQDRKLDAKFAEQDRKIDSIDRKVDALSSDMAAVLKILGEQFGPRTS